MREHDPFGPAGRSGGVANSSELLGCVTGRLHRFLLHCGGVRQPVLQAQHGWVLFSAECAIKSDYCLQFREEIGVLRDLLPLLGLSDKQQAAARIAQNKGSIACGIPAIDRNNNQTRRKRGLFEQNPLHGISEHHGDTVAALEIGGTQGGAPPTYLQLDLFPGVWSPRVSIFVILTIRGGIRSARRSAAQQSRKIAGFGTADEVCGVHERPTSSHFSVAILGGRFQPGKSTLSCSPLLY